MRSITVHSGNRMFLSNLTVSRVGQDWEYVSYSAKSLAPDPRMRIMGCSWYLAKWISGVCLAFVCFTVLGVTPCPFVCGMRNCLCWTCCVLVYYQHHIHSQLWKQKNGVYFAKYVVKNSCSGQSTDEDLQPGISASFFQVKLIIFWILRSRIFF